LLTVELVAADGSFRALIETPAVDEGIGVCAPVEGGDATCWVDGVADGAVTLDAVSVDVPNSDGVVSRGESLHEVTTAANNTVATRACMRQVAKIAPSW
jgi:hypothetical protein